MPASLAPPPRPVLFALTGAAAGLLVALSFGELTWHLVRPTPPAAPEPQAGPPAVRLAVSASPKALVYCGARVTVLVRVARGDFEGPLILKLTSPERGLSAAEVAIPAGEAGGALQVAATEDAKPGTYTVTVEANAPARSLTASATAEVTVVAVPAFPPRLGVTVSPKVPVHQHGKNRFTVFVVRGDFDGPVTVSFDGLPPGVTAPAVTIPAGKGEATAEVTAADDAKLGSHEFTAVARAAEVGVEGEARGAVEVLPSVKLPADVVFALDCTGSMKSTVAGLRDVLPRFAAELARSRLDVHFGLVGFKDTTLGQPLKVVRVGGEKLTADLAGFRAAVGELRLGGGGGEGESSLDAIAEAADYRFRDGAARAIVLVTDGPPKRIDGRISGTDDAVRYLRERKVDQLQLVALPEHRRAFEPLSVAFKGRFTDLKAARELGDFEGLAVVLARAIAAASPEVPAGRAEPAKSAPQPSLSPPGSAKLPALTPSSEPGEPRLEKPTTMPTWEEAPISGAPAESEGARLAWAAVVGSFVVLTVLAVQLIVLPGEKPNLRSGAACYGVAILPGAVAGGLVALAFGSLAGPLAARLGGATLFGLAFGLTLPLAERAFRRPELLELPPGELEELPPDEGTVAPRPLAVKPNITPPRAADGCPGCGRVIPGAPGERYCMLCDRTF